MRGTPGEPGSFVSDQARDAFMTAYDRAFTLWPRPWEEFDVETEFATTHVHRYGPRAGSPVVLLSGAGFNASNWYDNVAALGGEHPVFGIDTPGDPNRSVARAPITPPDTMAAWLDQVLAAIGGPPAHLVGVSYGGWIALNQALRAPRRVASVAALEPAGLTPLDARFWRWLTINGLASLAPRPLRRHLAGWLGSPMLAVPELMAVMWAGNRSYRLEPKFPDILTDDELRSITVPALVVTGSRSALISPLRARECARLMPRGEAAVISGSHGGFDHNDELNALLTAFIAKHGAATGTAGEER